MTLRDESGARSLPAVFARASDPPARAATPAGAEPPLYGAVEGGGTKFVCAVGTGPHDVRSRTRIDTRDPVATLAEVADFLARAARGRTLAAIGFACFGPLELDPSRPTYGSMLATPKPGWSGAPLVAPLRDRLNAQVVLDTDVNGAALAEWSWGSARGCDPAIYVTVGTGIGGGAVVHGRTLTGLLHPEMGHIPVARLPWPDGSPDDFPGVCPFHGACLEGLASGPALAARLGAPAGTAPPEHPIWELEAGYLAQALATYTLVLSPRRIVLGGGVFHQTHLLPRVRARLAGQLAGYITRPELASAIDDYVVAPHFAQDAGLYGAFALAMSGGSGAQPPLGRPKAGKNS
ncbi:MAG TPA: ROK family protein [Chloroflexota bacterium]|nr:ROK family protein [Chloroflexota bacterium]